MHPYDETHVQSVENCWPVARSQHLLPLSGPSPRDTATSRLREGRYPDGGDTGDRPHYVMLTRLGALKAFSQRLDRPRAIPISIFGTRRDRQVRYVFVDVCVGYVSVWVAESFAVGGVAACYFASSAPFVVSFHFFTSIDATSVSRTRPRLVTSSV